MIQDPLAIVGCRSFTTTTCHWHGGWGWKTLPTPKKLSLNDLMSNSESKWIPSSVLPFSKQTWQWNITIIDRRYKYIFKWLKLSLFFIVMLVFGSVMNLTCVFKLIWHVYPIHILKTAKVQHANVETGWQKKAENKNQVAVEKKTTAIFKERYCKQFSRKVPTSLLGISVVFHQKKPTHSYFNITISGLEMASLPIGALPERIGWNLATKPPKGEKHLGWTDFWSN